MTIASTSSPSDGLGSTAPASAAPANTSLATVGEFEMRASVSQPNNRAASGAGDGLAMVCALLTQPGSRGPDLAPGISAIGRGIRTDSPTPGDGSCCRGGRGGAFHE